MICYCDKCHRYRPVVLPVFPTNQEYAEKWCTRCRVDNHGAYKIAKPEAVAASNHTGPAAGERNNDD